MAVSNKELADAFRTACTEVEKDLPVLLHAVGATSVDPDAISLVASLTVEFTTKLIDAALECCDHQFPDTQDNFHPVARPKDDSFSKKRKESRPFDSPLPEPKVRRKETKPLPKTGSWFDEQEHGKLPPPSMADWVGTRGVDLWEDIRIPPAATRLSAHHFLFCLCHDTYLYGRIRQAITAKKTEFVPLLTDPVIQDMVQEEAALLKEQEREKHKSKQRKESAKKQSGDTSDGDDEEDEKEDEVRIEDDETPSWPNLSGLLPVFRDSD